MHPKDNELIPIGTRCFWKKRKIEVVVVSHSFQFQGRNFLNYEVREVNGRIGNYAAYHGDLVVID